MRPQVVLNEWLWDECDGFYFDERVREGKASNDQNGDRSALTAPHSSRGCEGLTDIDARGDVDRQFGDVLGTTLRGCEDGEDVLQRLDGLRLDAVAEPSGAVDTVLCADVDRAPCGNDRALT